VIATVDPKIRPCSAFAPDPQSPACGTFPALGECPAVDQVLFNPQDAPFLTARYGNAIRYTLNPPTRQGGGNDWGAGAAEDWCEMPWTAAPEVLGGAAPVVDASHGDEGRIDRQRACHRATACTRKAPHWSVDPRRPE
jgi:hypothetical protein